MTLESFERILGLCVNVQQRSPEWLMLRMSRVTGSVAHSIFSIEDDMIACCEVLFEKLGLPSGFRGNIFTEWGSNLESRALDKLSRDHPFLDVRQVGFIEHANDPSIGISPDAIAFDRRTSKVLLIEVKCPFVRDIRKGIKDEYVSQVQLSLEVLRSHGLDCDCLFVQYTPHPTEDVTYEYVTRDPRWMVRFSKNLERFWSEVEAWRGRSVLEHPLYAQWELRKKRRDREPFVSRDMEKKFFKHVLVNLD
jgi:hypothetical protein